MLTLQGEGESEVGATSPDLARLRAPGMRAKESPQRDAGRAARLGRKGMNKPPAPQARRTAQETPSPFSYAAVFSAFKASTFIRFMHALAYVVFDVTGSRDVAVHGDPGVTPVGQRVGTLEVSEQDREGGIAAARDVQIVHVLPNRHGATEKGGRGASGELLVQR